MEEINNKIETAKRKAEEESCQLLNEVNEKRSVIESLKENIDKLQRERSESSTSNHEECLKKFD